MALPHLGSLLWLLQFLWFLIYLYDTAKSNIGYFRNTNGGLPLCNFRLHPLKPVIWTLCFVANKGMFFSFLLNSLAAYQTSCFASLVYFCLILTPELSESGAVTQAWHCHCQLLDLVYKSMLPNAKKTPKPNPNPHPHTSFIRSDPSLR